MTIRLAPHPLSTPRAYFLGVGEATDLTTPSWLKERLTRPDSPHDERIKKSNRDCLRVGGYRPAGRGKPSSESLLSAVDAERLSSINTFVDLGNALSLHTGLPISVVDVDRARPPFHFDHPEPSTRYVFNPSGQEIDLTGLWCLFDAEGPCANAVKDCQRTKTHQATKNVLMILWGNRELPAGILEAAEERLRRDVGRLTFSIETAIIETMS